MTSAKTIIVEQVVPDPDRIPVLDKGYVRYVDHLGSDLTVVNQARASFSKEVSRLGTADARLIDFLAERDETSPFRPAVVLLEIRAPIMVARQMFKHRIGSNHSLDTQNFDGQGDDGGFGETFYARNEASGRYLPMTECYVPDAYLSAPDHKKQGAGGPVDAEIAAELRAALAEHQQAGLELYQTALAAGLCAQQARLFLPYAGAYTTWRWLASLEAIAHFLDQRLAEKAQAEIQAYARAIHELVAPIFPKTLNALLTQHARRHPDRLAALDRLVDALRRRTWAVRNCGIGSEDPGLPDCVLDAAAATLGEMQRDLDQALRDYQQVDDQIRARYGL